MKVQDRLDWGHHTLKPVHARYCIVYQTDPEQPCKVFIPDPHWLAAALHGDILPTVESYQALRMDGAGNVLNGHVFHEHTQPAMTEEEAMEYLLPLVVPMSVWGDRSSNRRRFALVPIATIPSDRTWRKAWRLSA